MAKKNKQGRLSIARRRQKSMRKDVDMVLDYFVQLSQFDFAELKYWFEPILSKYSIREDGFDRSFIESLAYCGWFIFACETLVPKFHLRRCFIDLQGWDFNKWLTTIQKNQLSLSDDTNSERVKLKPLLKAFDRIASGKYKLELSLNSNIHEALKLTNEFQFRKNGVSWLEPELCNVLEMLCSGKPELARQLEVLSWELYDQTRGQIISADLGIRVGKIFTSLSGFSDRRFPSIGIVHLVSQAKMMKQLQLMYWDLGMEVGYKADLGTSTFGRKASRAIYHHFRDDRISATCPNQSIQALLDLSPDFNIAKSEKELRPKQKLKSQQIFEIEKKPIDTWNKIDVSLWVKSVFPDIEMEDLSGVNLLKLTSVAKIAPSKNKAKTICKLAKRLWHKQQRHQNCPSDSE